jgi:outer membrane receptor for ferrienterochelin and colicin
VVVITRKDMEAYGYQSLKEVLSNLQGMYMTDNYQNMRFGIRGFYSNAYNRNIVFLINGVVQQVRDSSGSDTRNFRPILYYQRSEQRNRIGNVDCDKHYKRA